MILTNKQELEQRAQELKQQTGDISLTEAKEDRYPRVGPFYFYKDSIIAPEEYQRYVDPMTFQVERVIGNSIGSPKEHRDMWDNYMVTKFPELKTIYHDDHKALSRGRVDYSVKNNKLSFFVTLDKCITGKENEIKRLYQLLQYVTDFSYGTMNYKCKNCK